MLKCRFVKVLDGIFTPMEWHFFNFFFRLSSPEKEIALETLDNVIKEAEISLNNSHNSASAPQPQRYEIFVNFFVKSISRNFF